jgi:hypothetical protein
LQNPDHFDPLKLSRYTVIRVYYEFPGQRGEEKLFIVLRHAKEKDGHCCWCIKATCRTLRYEADPLLMKGALLYEPRVLPFFYERTIIDPANLIRILHSHLTREAIRGRYRIEGKMPDDFPSKLAQAISESAVLEPKKAKYLLACLKEAS